MDRAPSVSTAPLSSGLLSLCVSVSLPTMSGWVRKLESGSVPFCSFGTIRATSKGDSRSCLRTAGCTGLGPGAPQRAWAPGSSAPWRAPPLALRLAALQPTQPRSRSVVLRGPSDVGRDGSPLRGPGHARVTAGPKRPHLGVCPRPTIPLQVKQASRGCIPQGTLEKHAATHSQSKDHPWGNSCPPGVLNFGLQPSSYSSSPASPLLLVPQTGPQNITLNHTDLVPCLCIQVGAESSWGPGEGDQGIGERVGPHLPGRFHAGLRLLGLAGMR